MQRGDWKGVYGDVDSIFRAGLARVDPYALLRSSVTVTGDTLAVTADDAATRYDLRAFDEVLVIGAGKATARMALAVEEVLGPRLSAGLIAVKKGHEEKLVRIECVAAGHPVPDIGSLEAGRRIRDLCAAAGERTLIVNLLSGGGSALLSLPVQWEAAGRRVVLQLADIQATTQALLGSGATIQEINAVRKHLSAIKGGRLAEAAAPAAMVTLILSDVVGDSLGSIASGLTTADSSTFADALEVVRKFRLESSLPANVLATLRAGAEGRIPETPKEGDAAFAKTRNILLGTNASALRAAETEARRRGYATSILASGITGEAREIAKVFLAIARDISRGRGPLTAPACILAGGETTVTLCGSHGRGGRNQEMALSFLYELSRLDASLDDVCFFSGATDGNDGPTDAAGAFASMEAIAAGRARGLDPLALLEGNDSYRYFDAAGFLYRTGPTNTNVCDIQILIVR